MSKIKKICINVLLVLLSLFSLLLFLEFIAFRLFLLPSDLPKLDFVNGLIKYVPNQKGVYRVKNEIEATYNINANGWNSMHDKYNINNPTNKYRIAVLGDSYVQAFEVNFNKSIAEKLESKLGREHFEVYRFGIDGAPMSQYLHILRKEAFKYNPDLVVVVLIHNDFSESYQFLRGTLASNFMKLEIDNGTVIEIPPEQFQSQWYAAIRESATWRFLFYRQKIPFYYLTDLLLGNKAKYQANISIDSLNVVRAKNETATNYIFQKMKEYCDNKGTDFLIVMNGDIASTYRNIDKNQLYKTGALSLNVIAKKASQRNGIYFIDLEPVFEADFRENQKRLTFINDGHWNERGHEVAANAIYQFIKNKLLGLKGKSK